MNIQVTHETLIIGAGPSGLAVAGCLQKHGHFFVMLEQGDKAGNAWHYHYERLHLHTDKLYSALPHFPFPENFPTYVPRAMLAQYYEDYARKFYLQPLFQQSVRRVSRTEEGTWRVETTTHVFFARNVVVATGQNRVALAPKFAGQENFTGVILHSRAYRNAKPFAGKRVLVVGMGNTGAEIALDLVEKGATPFISVRGAVNIVSRDVGGRPAQRSVILLSKLPNFLYDAIARLTQKLTIGDLSQYGIVTPAFAPARQVREMNKVPVFDLGTVNEIKRGTIKVLPGIKEFRANSVVFTNGREEEFDAVILCTGYRPQIHDFIEGGEVLNGKNGYPEKLWYEQEQWQGLYFLGYGPAVDGILRMIAKDAETIAGHIKSNTKNNKINTK